MFPTSCLRAPSLELFEFRRVEIVILFFDPYLLERACSKIMYHHAIGEEHKIMSRHKNVSSCVSDVPVLG